MIEGTFDVAIDTPKYHRRGTLALKSAGEHIDARLTIGDDNLIFSGTCQDKEFDFAGEGDFLALGHMAYSAHGSVCGNSISITSETDAGKIEIFGTRLSTSAGDFRSSHEYVMSASTGDFANNESTMYSGLYADGG